MVDDLVDLGQGQGVSCRRLGHDVCHRQGGDAFEMQRVSLDPDDEPVRRTKSGCDLGWQSQGVP